NWHIPDNVPIRRSDAGRVFLLDSSAWQNGCQTCALDKRRMPPLRVHPASLPLRLPFRAAQDSTVPPPQRKTHPYLHAKSLQPPRLQGYREHAKKLSNLSVLAV